MIRERHVDYADDDRFTLATKAQHGGCPEMVTRKLSSGRGKLIPWPCTWTWMVSIPANGFWAVRALPGADTDAEPWTRRVSPGPIGANRPCVARAIPDNSLSAHHFLFVARTVRRPGGPSPGRSANRSSSGGGPAYLSALRPNNVAFVEAGKGGLTETELLLLGQTAKVAVVKRRAPAACRF